MKPIALSKARLLKALIYGDSGSGKTTLVGSAMKHPKMAPVLVLNARGQPISLATLDPPPLVVEIESFKDFNIPYEWFIDGQERGAYFQEQLVNPPNAPTHKQRLSTGRGGRGMKEFAILCADYLDRWGFDKFNTVAVDSITHTQRKAIAQATGQGGVAPGTTPKPTEIQHWGSVLRMMANLTDLYFRLDVNVIMTALTRRDTLESMGLTLFCPFLWGQSSLEVPSHAEIVGRLVVAETLTAKQRQDLGMPRDARAKSAPYNVLLTRGGRNFIAKWQGVANPPESVPAPTATALWEVLSS